MIRDRLVCGISEETIQKCLLAESKLTYKKAVELALGLKTANKNVKLLRNNQKELDSIRSHPRIDHVAPQKKERDVIALICFRCGKPGHIAPKCKLANSGIVCHQCGKSGHIQRACKSGQKGTAPKGQSRPVRQVQEEEEAVNLLMVQEEKKPHSSPPIEMKVKIDDCLVKMEVDTGATISLMSQKTFRQLWPRRTLKPTEVRLCSYSKDPIPVVGCCYVNLAYKDQTAINMPLLIVQGSGPSLFGRNWLKEIILDWNEIHHVWCDSLQVVLDKYPSVFQEGLETLKGFQAKIHVDPHAKPRFFKARTVPYAFRDKVEVELKWLQKEGTLEPVEIFAWASPIVPVLKSDKTSVRICGDFRVTMNPVSKLDTYPIPKIKDLFATQWRGNCFSKLDLSQAYQ